MKLLDRIDSLLFPDKQEITEEVIQYYEKHPDELDLIIDREHFNALYLGLFFFLGLFLTILARLISYFYGATLGNFVNTVILDVISEIGIAIFGGAVVAYLIEYLNKKQYQSNLKFRRQIKAIIDQRQQNK